MTADRMALLTVEATNRALSEHTATSARVAAAWWASQLRSAAGKGDNGSDDRISMMAMGMTSLIHSKHPPTEENCERFESDLARRIAEILETDGADYRCYWDNQGWDDGGVDLVLSVDYHPCEVLLSALEVAGVDRNVREIAALPLKTTMRVSARRVLLGAGYRAPWREIHGPVWGCTYAERQSVDLVRDRNHVATWDRWHSAGAVGPRLSDWQGPVRP